MRSTWILTPREKEFILDWKRVVEGELPPIEFYRKWATRKDDRSFLDDYEAVKRGEMSVEEFRRKWSEKGDWKDYVRVMRHRLDKKRRNVKRILAEINEELRLLKWFFENGWLP